MKKVLIFSLSYYPNSVSGAEVALKELTDRMPDIEFHMVTLRYNARLPRSSTEGNVHVHRIGFATNDPTFADLGKWPLDLNKPLYQFLAALKALSLHRQIGFDCIWAMMAHSTGVPAALFKMFHPRVPYVLTLQEGDPPEYIEKVMRPLWPLFTRAFTRADAVTAISAFLARWAKRRGVRVPVMLIPNGASVAPRTFPPEELAELRTAVGRTDGDVLLTSVSRLVHQKAIDIVLRALALLPSHIRFLIVGDGPDRAELERLAKELSVDSRTIFVGAVDRTMTAKYRSIADIFVTPSRSEGQGIAFLSAMASGLPVIATQEGGLEDFIFDAKRNPDNETTAWAVDVDSPEGIADAVRDILANPEKTRSVVATTRTMVKEKYNWDMIARDMREKVFAPLLG